MTAAQNGRAGAAAAAAAELAARDRTLAALVEEHGPPRFHVRRTGQSRYEQLAEAIAYQQLAGKAALAIWTRVRACVDGPFTPEAVLALGEAPLRAAGFSNAKTLSLLDLSAKVAAGDVKLDRIGRLDDEAVIESLVTVRGIGRWTAEMFLIFTLGRLDVWPTGDLGVRAGYAKAFGLEEMPSPKALEPLGDPYRPYRSVLAWYCWRSVAPLPG